MAKRETKQLPASHVETTNMAAIASEASQVMSMPQWERSYSDAAADRNVVRNIGGTVGQYEGSALDEANDAKQLSAHNRVARQLSPKG